ncbi:MAG: polyprenyl synthetase family protein [Planctomycetota bacterium]
MSSATAAIDRSKQTASTKQTESLREIYAPITKWLTHVNERLSRELQSQYEALRPVLHHGTQLGGKRLRPALLLLAAEAVSADRRADAHANRASDSITDDHVVMATVVEMVHTATLIHDDVLDQAMTRRHVPTINARWDSDTSLLLGDYLFAQSFQLAATLPSTRACRWVGGAARSVCEGELRQVLSRDWLDMDEETYLDMLRGKTAELTRVSCQLGADLSGGNEDQIAALGTFGNDLGIAFQIVDDVLDLWGDDDHVGKTLGSDLMQGKLTLPLIHLLRSQDSSIASRALRALRLPPHARLDAIMPLLKQTNAASYASKVADSYRDSAIRAIDGLADSDAKRSLVAIAEFSVRRRF